MMERNFLFRCILCGKGFIKRGVVRIYETLNGFLKYIIHDSKKQEQQQELKQRLLHIWMSLSYIQQSVLFFPLCCF